MRQLFFGLFFLASSLLFSQESPIQVVHEEIIDSGFDHFDSHGVTLAEVAPQIIVASWYGGQGKGLCDFEKEMEQSIWISRYEGGRWFTPKKLLSHEKKCWNPVLFSCARELLLFYKVGKTPQSWVGMLVRSFDGGENWEKERPLPAGILGPIRSKPLLTKEGKLICPSSWESGDVSDPYKAAACWIEITGDLGKTWKKIGPLVKPNLPFGIIQPSLFLDKKETLHLFARDLAPKIGKEGVLWRSSSKDGGVHWEEMSPTKIPNPDAAVETLQLKSNRVLLIYNPRRDKRAPLQIDFSDDGGKTWEKGITLESEEGEYSYPAAIQSSDGRVHLLYSHALIQRSQRKIKHVILEIEGD